MAAPAPRVVLVTGASSGIGLACAERLLRDGHRVYGASRSIRSAELPAACRGLERLPMDVTDEDSVRRGVAAVAASSGRIDVVVNAAGYGLAGAAEEIAHEEAARQMDANFFGCVRVVRHVLPVMRRQKAGLVVNVSSLGGLVGVPFQSMYSASKFALEGWSEALRAEVAPHGVRVVLVEPGDVRTGFTDHRVRARAAARDGAYSDALARCIAVAEADERTGPAPAVVAGIVAKVVGRPAPKLRYRSGSASQRALFALRPFLPGALVEWLVRRHYRVG